jgi:hypothetical protein
MPRTASIALRTLAATAIAAVCATGWTVAMGISGCITAPPPELPALPQQEPTILQNDVRPAVNEDLTTLPPDDVFIVPIVPGRPDPSVQVNVYVDFDPGSDNLNGNATPAAYSHLFGVTPDTVDGGIYSIRFSLGPNQLGDPRQCHWIELLVTASTESFESLSSHTPNVFSDSVSWHYVPDPLAGCFQFDAGQYQDGAFPPDAPPDALPVTPTGVGQH